MTVDIGVMWTLKKGGTSKYHQVWIDDNYHTLCGHIAGKDANIFEGMLPFAIAHDAQCKACHYLRASGAADYYRQRRGGRISR